MSHAKRKKPSLIIIDDPYREETDEGFARRQKAVLAWWKEADLKIRTRKANQ